MMWADFLKQEIEAEYFYPIRNKICDDMLLGHKICPAGHSMFRIFEDVEYDKIKVVILGQDPYYAKLDEANGYAFAVGENIKTPSSLRNIFKEIAANFNSEAPKDKTLEYIVKQGVFLLNTALTTRFGEAYAHGKYWQPFTDKVISVLNDRDEPIIFMLWGKKAIAKKPLLTNKHHFVLEASHPSGLSAYRGFLGCGHFAEANRILGELGKSAINWVE